MTSKCEVKQDGPRRVLRFGGLLALGIALGIGGGVMSSPDPVQAQDDAFCEQDECEGSRPWWRLWRWTEMCVNNVPHNTGCNMTGDYRCYTYGCGGPTGGGGSGSSGNDDEQ